MVAKSSNPKARRKTNPADALPLVATGQGGYVKNYPHVGEPSKMGDAHTLELAAAIARGEMSQNAAACYPPATWKRIKTLSEAVNLLDQATAAFIKSLRLTTSALVSNEGLTITEDVTRVLADALAAALLGEGDK